MDRSALAQQLRHSTIAAVRAFRRDRPGEHPYALALVGDPEGRGWVRFAIATEESLRETARKYSELGYRYKRQEWEAADNLERLSVWLRWVNPDDGWQFGDFADSEALCRSLRLLFDRSQGNEFEEFCTDAVLAPLSRDSAWSGDPLSRSLIVGFTYGENPLDFLRSATRANPYPRVMELWRQHWESQNLGHRIKRRS